MQELDSLTNLTKILSIYMTWTKMSFKVERNLSKLNSINNGRWKIDSFVFSIRKWYYKGLLCEEVIKIYVDKNVGECIKEACQGVH